MYRLSKLLFALFIINYIWFNRTIGGPAWINYLLIAGFIISGLLASNDFSKRKGFILRIDKYFIYWAIFTIYMLLTGIFVAIYFNFVLKQVMFMAEVVLIIMYVNIVWKKDDDLNFFYKVFMFMAALYTISMLKNGITHAGSGRLYLAENSNPNSDGIVLAFGVYSTLKLINFKRIRSIIPLIILSIFELYAIFLTGSRKSLILAVLFFIFVFMRIWNCRQDLSKSAKIFLCVVSLISFAFGVLWLLPEFVNSSAYLRLQNADVGIQDRWNIACDALFIFTKHPVFGVGINNYLFYSKFGLYAHSTLPELLADTGIIGTILFYMPYISVVYSLLKKRMNKKDRLEIWRLLICIFAVGFVMIIPFGMPLCFFSVMLFYETELAIKRAKD